MPQNVKLLVTRQFPTNVLERCQRDYNCTLNPKDTDWPDEELIDQSSGHDAIFFSSGNKFTADVIAALPNEVKILTTKISKFTFFVKKKVKLTIITQHKKNDPIDPDKVLFGLIFVNFGPLNIFPIIYPPMSEAIQESNIKKIKIFKLKCNE